MTADDAPPNTSEPPCAPERRPSAHPAEFPGAALPSVATATALTVSTLATAHGAAASARPAGGVTGFSTPTEVNAPVAHPETAADLDATIRFHHGVLGPLRG